MILGQVLNFNVHCNPISSSHNDPGTIADNLPAGQTSCQWQVGKTLTGWASPGVDFKVRVSSLESSSSAGASYYIYDSGGKLLAEYDCSGACVKDYLYLGGKMIGEYVPTTGSYYYYASDQINSTRLVTDATGAVVHSAQYDPYGGLYKTWVDTYHPKPGFSGKERESSSELDYFGARYYGHRQYRFISVDPVINKDEALLNPQFWNLYAYCGNNPITYFDPDGYLQRKANGDLIFITGPDNYRDIQHMGDTTKVNHVKWGYLKTDSGKRILADQNMSKDSRYDTDCHGATFADGKYWINNNQVKDILIGDNYKEITDPQAGDIVVWFDKKSNDVVHSMTVQSVTGEGVFVKGKAGISSYQENVPLKNAWNSDDSAKFYRK
jgi:RHS repeat-associated protein